MEFLVLGPLEVHGDRGPVDLRGQKPRAVLAVLLLHANEPVSWERLALAVWGEDASADAREKVQVNVSRLRKALGDPAILATRPSGYELRVRPGELDADRFERCVAEGRRALEAGQPEDASEILSEGLSLWRGSPLAELSFEAFAQADIARLEEQRLAALETRVDADLAAGRHADLIGELRQLAADHPTRERLAGQLMLALYRCGRQADALEVFRATRERLVADIAVEPGPELRSLQEAILRQDASLDLRRPVPDLPSELDPAAAPPLAGRSAELEWLRQRWKTVRTGAGAVVAVTGPRGIGKSRLAAELAGEVHSLGSEVLYAAGAAPAEAILTVIGRAREATQATLLVVDDADQAPADALAKLDELKRHSPAVPVLAIVCGEDADVLARLRADGALELRALDVAGVRAIATFYAPDTAGEEVPAEWLREASGGIPARVHELASQWARRHAAERVGAVAGRAASGRAELRSMERELAGGVVQLQTARERVERRDDGEDRVVCPFKGLASFEAADAPYFFGREQLLAELVARLVGAPLLGVVGPSGSGKSSVVRAGLLPALANGVLPGSEQWPQVLIRPGEHPLRELRDALAGLGSARRMVLAVDQFEETFTACRDEEERTRFISELVRASRGDAGAVVVLAVRADYYGRCAAYPELSRLLSANHVLVGPMRRAELERAVVCPAQRAGLHVEGDLVEALVDDVENAPGALPLLSAALLDLWQRRDGRRLRLASYEQTGGVRKAVARLAEDAFSRLDETQQALVRPLLLRLVEVGDDGSVERRRLPLEELRGDDGDDATRVLAQLADARLLTISEGSVELAHEALLREWPRLRGWIEDDLEGLRIERSLSAGAREWLRVGRDDGALYRGARLAEARDWSEHTDLRLTDLERDFLDASLERERRDRQTRRRRLTLAFGTLGVALVAIAAIALVALDQRRDAERQRDIAVSHRLAATATNALDAAPARSLRLALRAVNAAPTTEAGVALRQATLQTRSLAVLRGHRGRVFSASFSPDGRRVVSAGLDGTVRLWDPDRERPLRSIRGHRGAVFQATFSPDGERIASVGDDGTVAVTDVAGRDRRVILRARSGLFFAIDFSPDGRRIVAAADDGRVYIAHADGRGAARVVGRHRSSVTAVRFGADGTRIVSGDETGRLRVWDLASGDSHEIFAHRHGVTRAAFTRNDRTIISAGLDGRITTRDAATGAEMSVLKDPGGFVFAAASSPDATRIAAGGPHGTVRIWDAASRAELAALRGHRDDVLDVGFSPTGERVVSAGEDGTVRVWNPPVQRIFPALPGIYGAALSFDASRILAWGEGGIEILDASDGTVRAQLGDGTASAAALSRDGRWLISGWSGGVVRISRAADDRSPSARRAHAKQVNDTTFSPDGRHAVTGGDDGRVIVWRLDDRRPAVALKHGSRVNAARFSADGKRVLSAGGDGTVRIWRADRPASPLVVLKGDGQELNAAAFSADGRRLVTGATDGTVRLWRAKGADERVLRGHTGQVTAVAFSRDGSRIASGGGDGRVRIWDSRSGRPLAVLTQHAGSDVVSVGFTPDGRDVLSAGVDGTIRVTRCEVCGSLVDTIALARARLVR